MFHSKNARMVQHMQINKNYTTYKRSKDKNHLLISTAAEKAFEKYPTFLYAKSPEGIRNRRIIPHYNDDYIEKNIAGK
jgi:hypothetical protein